MISYAISIYGLHHNSIMVSHINVNSIIFQPPIQANIKENLTLRQWLVDSHRKGQ